MQDEKTRVTPLFGYGYDSLARMNGSGVPQLVTFSVIHGYEVGRVTLHFDDPVKAQEQLGSHLSFIEENPDAFSSTVQALTLAELYLLKFQDNFDKNISEIQPLFQTVAALEQHVQSFSDTLVPAIRQHAQAEYKGIK